MSDDTKKWGRKGRMMQWLQVVLSGCFLLAILLGVNILARDHYVRKDMTSDRSFALDDFTKKMLSSLDRDVTLYLVPPGPQEGQDRALGPVWQKIHILCGEFQKRSPRIRVKQITEADPAAMEELKQHFEVLVTNSIYFLGDQGGERYSIKALQVKRGKFYDGNPNTGEVINFWGERWLVAGIRSVTMAQKRIVYSVIGHGEASADQGLRVLMRFLEEREGIELRPIVLRDITKIPSDATCVLIPGPRRAFSVAEFDVLESYLGQGGSLFLALYPLSKRGEEWGPRTGFNEFLKGYGIKQGLGFVCDAIENYRGDVRFIPARRFGGHPINTGVQNLNTTITLPYVSVIEKRQTVPPYCTVTPLLFSAPTSWEEQGRVEQVRPRPDGEERLSPDDGMPIGMAVSTRLAKPGQNGREDARIVLWGSAQALGDANLVSMGYPNVENLEYILNTFRWLMGEEKQISIPPKRPGQRPLDLTPDVLDRIKWITLLGFPALGFIVGILAWFLRRK